MISSPANSAPALYVSEADREPAARRLMSVDALRGFDMIWIIGGAGVGGALRGLQSNRFTQALAHQLEHSDWQGCVFYDLIFPLFIFLVGLSITFSLPRILIEQGKRAAYWRVIRRSFILYALGVFFYGGLSQRWPNIKLVGVLQRIALCYCFAGLIFCTFRVRQMIAICFLLLVGYWAAMTFVPVPGLGPGHFERGKNLANFIDQKYLSGTKSVDGWDPEGLLSTFPSISGCLIGVFAGLWIKHNRETPHRVVVGLIAAGAVMTAAGWAWGLQFPVIKRLWTSSFILVTSGYSCLLMALFYQIIDVWKLRSWAWPFVWVGMNPLTIYLFVNIVDIRKLAQRFVGGDIQHAFGRSGDLLVHLAGLGLCVALCGFLYRRKIFLRV